MCHKLIINQMNFSILRLLYFFKGKFAHEIIGMLHLSMYVCAKMISHVNVYDLDDLMHSNGYNFNSWFLSEGNR